MKPINVRSEIAPLKKVLLHRPGKELLNLNPFRLSELLFDDIPFLDEAMKEHDAFVELFTPGKDGVETGIAWLDLGKNILSFIISGLAGIGEALVSVFTTALSELWQSIINDPSISNMATMISTPRR